MSRFALHTPTLSPYCPLGNTGSFFALLPVGQYGLFLALLPVGQYGLIFARGCATLHPGLCSGTHSGRGWWDRSDGVGHLGVFALGCVLAPFQGANSRSVRN